MLHRKQSVRAGAAMSMPVGASIASEFAIPTDLLGREDVQKGTIWAFARHPPQHCARIGFEDVT
jgi:hypothetical protein